MTRDGYATAGAPATANGGHTADDRADDRASTRLLRAADALQDPERPLPPAALSALAGLLLAEAAWAAARHDTYPTDRAPLLHLADLINGDPTL